METILKKTDLKNIDMNVIKEAARIIKSGGLVAFPTETVYGLGANGLDKEASSKIYEAKGRPSDNPLILHISNTDELKGIVREIPPKAVLIMKAFWPGPLTLIFNKGDIVPYETTGGLDTVAVRMPNHPVALKLIEESGVPIAAPSANISGRPSPTTANHVYEDLNDRIDMIIDGGQVNIGLESTIIDVTGDVPMILRPGYITAEMIKKVVGDILYDKVVLARNKEDIKGNYKPKAPGMKYRHYAPKADFTMYEGSEGAVIKKINEMIAANKKENIKTGVIATDETATLYDSYAQVISLGKREDEDTIAHNLYGALRNFDSNGIEKIYGETFSGDGFGQAIMNRLTKAAGYHIENVNDL